MISHVLSCSVSECAYNKKRECHALGIKVGSDHAMCDTFSREASMVGEEPMPSVTKCNVDICRFNMNLDCMAPGITVANHSDHADCFTFVPKS
jgi:hypothetical protein